MPHLETPRLILRAMHQDDVDALLAIFGDPKVMAAFGVAPFDRGQMEGWVRRNLGHQAAHGFGLFSVVLKENGLLVGDCGLELMEVESAPVAELGYDVRSDYWNRGLATEAATAVRDFAFGTLQLPRLISLIRQGNHASRHVAEKIGMHLESENTRGGAPYWLFAMSQPSSPPASVQ